MGRRARLHRLLRLAPGMRSRRECTRRSKRTSRCGTFRTCLSTRTTSVAALRRSSASTRNRERAASRSCCEPLRARAAARAPGRLRPEGAKRLRMHTRRALPEEIYEVFRTNYRAVDTPYEIVSYRKNDSSESGDPADSAATRRRQEPSEIVGDRNGRSPHSCTASRSGAA